MGKEKDRQTGAQAQGTARTPLGVGSLPGSSLALQLRMASLRLSLTGKSDSSPILPGWDCVVLDKSLNLIEPQFPLM